MQAVTLRRLMVFGVCLLGVGALYLVPSMARAPDQIGGAPLPEETPRVRATSSAPSTWSAPAARSTVTTTTTTVVEPPSQSQPPRLSELASEPAPGPGPANEAPDPIESQVPRAEVSTSRPVSTPFVAGPEEDETPPAAVTALESRPTADQLRLVWAPGIDDVGVIRYRIWLDGYEVQTTVDTAATLDWFNDDSAQHVVQVRAVDAAGNESEAPATLLVTRPTPSPTAEPTSTPSPSASSSESPSPSESDSTDDGGNG